MQLPNQIDSNLKCIRTSFEFVILDSVRECLGLSRFRLRAPYFEIDTITGEYIRHCHLIIKTKMSSGHEFPRPLLLGCNLKNQTLEFYLTDCLVQMVTYPQTVRYAGNWVYAVLDLNDKSSWTAAGIKRVIRSVRDKIDNLHPLEPLWKVPASFSTVGPYVWSSE